jgi:hypothetical protein
MDIKCNEQLTIYYDIDFRTHCSLPLYMYGYVPTVNLKLVELN